QPGIVSSLDGLPVVAPPEPAVRGYAEVADVEGHGALAQRQDARDLRLALALGQQALDRPARVVPVARWRAAGTRDDVTPRDGLIPSAGRGPEPLAALPRGVPRLVEPANRLPVVPDRRAQPSPKPEAKSRSGDHA